MRWFISTRYTVGLVWWLPTSFMFKSYLFVFLLMSEIGLFNMIKLKVRGPGKHYGAYMDYEWKSAAFHHYVFNLYWLPVRFGWAMVEVIMEGKSQGIKEEWKWHTSKSYFEMIP